MANRFALLLLLLSGAAGCSIAPPPVCCPAQAPYENASSLRARASGVQTLIDTKLQPAWPYGLLLNVQFADPSMASVGGYNDADDSALWTGVYAAAQAYRYAAATAPDEKEAALTAVRGAVDALHVLATVPGYPGGVARVASKDPRVLAGDCASGPKDYCYETNGIYWLGNTSRDQYTGWFFGMSRPYFLVPDPRTREVIANDVRTVITAIHDWKYKLHDRDGKVNSGTAGDVHHQMRLAWHLIAARILDEPKYWQWYREQTSYLDLAKADLEDVLDATNVYYDYYGFNLGYLNAFSLVVLENEPKLKAFYLRMLQDDLYRYVANTDNVFFDYMTKAAGGVVAADTIPKDRSVLATFPGPPSAWYCAAPPRRRLSPKSVLYYDLNRLLSALAKQEAFPQSATPYPLHERCRVNFIWQASPYKESCCCDCGVTRDGCPASTYSPAYCASKPTPQTGFVVYPGADYLIAYWMGRYYNYLSAED